MRESSYIAFTRQLKIDRVVARNAEIARFGQLEQSSQDGLRLNEVNAFSSLRRSR